ncbi:MAG: FADH(2)-oxidizing methylenetetrahydrofolate--tRNA-(uracil(54)-C(5))-methyltransferase TrmFO [Peptococcaceae bacterium]|nr:FADH(2)-oxidizing methylenetetrahydrofolate--tRNA-(uracil(54)-C(5))-methyltransferase TrmFO [Peptococcaceae bacterium]
MNKKVNVIGAGLAGSEAAWQLAERGISVTLYEMRPEKMTPAHHTELFGELVCSNSLRANNIENAVGLMKEELRRCNSLILACADMHQVPAGGALAVDREKFSAEITARIKAHPLIEVVYGEVTEINQDEITIIATGPLTDGAMAEQIKKLTGQTEGFYFYDAAAPIVTAESINYDKAFWASRYDKGDADYLNCPMSEEEYNQFYDALINAEWAETKDFEKAKFFEGCMPIEEMARRGKQTLVFGPMKPVGLIDKRVGKEAYAVVQLRKDNQEGTLFNIVGFQTRMKWGEQKRVLQMIPGLEEAEIVRYGVMHRNTFVNGPLVMESTSKIRGQEKVFLAGQITGVEGYVESTACGLVAGINAARLVNGEELVTFPLTTAIGGLMNYITTADSKSFQPMNINFSLIPGLGRKIRNKKEKNGLLAERALADLQEFLPTIQ